MEEIIKFKKFNELKKVYRFNSVGDRKESSAEHSWSSLMLADFFLNQMELKIDRLKVYELLMYHDVIEIETGDVPLDPYNSREGKKENEFKGMHILKDKLPKSMRDKFVELFTEFEEHKTIEAQFAIAIDKMDAIIHEIDLRKTGKAGQKSSSSRKKRNHSNHFQRFMTCFRR